MGNWRVQKVTPSTYYNVAELLECKRQRNGLNSAKVSLAQGTGLADDTEVKLYDASDTLVLHGYTKKKDTSTVGLDVYEIVEVAVLLGDYLVQDPAWSNNYNLSYTSQTVNYIVDKIVASAPGWVRGGNVITVVNSMSYYFSPCLSALYKLLKDTMKINVWFDSATKTVYYGDYRTNRGVITYLTKETTSHSQKRKVNKVVVVGASNNLFGYGWDLVANPKTVAFQFNDVKSTAEADLTAMRILDRYGSSYSKIKVHLTPRVDIWDSDKVTVDAVDYIVDMVDIKYEETVLSLIPYGVFDVTETLSTVMDNRLKDVSLDVLGNIDGSGKYVRKDVGAGIQTVNNQLNMAASDVCLYTASANKFYNSSDVLSGTIRAFSGLYAYDLKVESNAGVLYLAGAAGINIVSALTGNLNIGGNNIIGLGAPTLVNDAARYKDGWIICTSATRPSSPTVGMHIFETDTLKDYKCTVGGATPTWVEVGAGGTWNGGTVTNDIVISKLNPLMSIRSTGASSPALDFRDSAGNTDAQLYTVVANDTVLVSNYGGLYLSTAAVNGGSVFLETKGVTRLTIADAAVTFAVDPVFGTQKLRGTAGGGSNVIFGDDISMLKAVSTYGDIKDTGSITPGVTDSKTLGTSSLYWSGIYGQAIYVDDASTKIDNNTGNMRLTVAAGKKFEFVVS